MTTATTSLLTRPAAVAAPMSVELRADYAACAQIARARARNFYYGLRLTPEPKRSAIYSVYAWMRAADDEADSPGSLADKQARLARFADAAEHLIRNDALADFESSPTWRAFRATFHDFHLDPRDLRDMMRGLEDDLNAEYQAAFPPSLSGRGPGSGAGAASTSPLPPSASPTPHSTRAPQHSAYPARQDLLQYCYRVASTVGLICITIWGLRDPAQRERARQLAVHRGHAFQLTNILRDFAQDLAEGRIYLPEEDFTRAGLTPHELRDWSNPRACEAMVKNLAAWARSEYRASAGLEDLIDPACVPTLWTMTEIYSGLLDLIERDPRRIASAKRIRLSSWRKGTLAVRAMMMSRREAR